MSAGGSAERRDAAGIERKNLKRRDAVRREFSVTEYGCLTDVESWRHGLASRRRRVAGLDAARPVREVWSMARTCRAPPAQARDPASGVRAISARAFSVRTYGACPARAPRPGGPNVAESKYAHDAPLGIAVGAPRTIAGQGSLGHQRPLCLKRREFPFSPASGALLSAVHGLTISMPVKVESLRRFCSSVKTAQVG